MTKYHRPMFYRGEAYDADGLCLQASACDTSEIRLNDALVYRPKDWDEFHQEIAVLHFEIAKALNTPVRATEAVLAGLEDGVHEVEVQLEVEFGGIGWFPVQLRECEKFSYPVVHRFELQDFHFIRATNEAALTYLLQFTQEGVKKDD